MVLHLGHKEKESVGFPGMAACDSLGIHTEFVLGEFILGGFSING